jgi:hypothetical protein
MAGSGGEGIGAEFGRAMAGLADDLARARTGNSLAVLGLLDDGVEGTALR